MMMLKKLKKCLLEFKNYEKNSAKFLSYKFVLAKLLEKIGINIICTKETSFNTHIWNKMDH